MITVDVGNSSIGVGRWRDGVVDVTRYRRPEEAAAALAGDGVAISVAPARLAALLAAARSQGCALRVLEGVPVPLADPRLASTAGADRLANAAAACPGPAVVVDAGTAVTIDLVDGAGVYRGGYIAPGPGCALEGLAAATAALPRLEAKVVALTPAVETWGAMLAGAWGLAVGGVDRLVEEALAALDGGPARLVATGGWGEAWAGASHLGGIVVDPAHVHRGIRRWAETP